MIRIRVAYALVCVVLIGGAGCAGQSNLLGQGPTKGQLKASLSHLEFENNELKRKTAKLEQENRTMENRLVQEEIDNGDLIARLDDARNLLRDRGVEPDVKLGSRGRAARDDSSAEEDTARGGRTMPASRSTRERRRPPFAQIAAPGKDLGSGDQDGQTDGTSPRRDARPGPARRNRDDDLDHHSFHSGTLQWLPVAGAGGANTTADSTIQVR